jgi:hypothetical protein
MGRRGRKVSYGNRPDSPKLFMQPAVAAAQEAVGARAAQAGQEEQVFQEPEGLAVIMAVEAQRGTPVMEERAIPKEALKINPALAVQVEAAQAAPARATSGRSLWCLVGPAAGALAFWEKAQAA